VIRKVPLKKPKPASENPGPTADERAEKRVAKKSLENQALELYVAGRTSGEIAEKLGLPSARSARQMIEREIDEQKSNRVDRLRDVTDLRLSQILDAYWFRAIGRDEDGNRTSPDPKATEKVLEIIDRHCRLNGLNSPVEVKLRDGMNEILNAVKRVVTPDDFHKVVSELAELGRTRAPGASPTGHPGVPPLGGFH
jgi:hypothetical protein